MRLISIVFIPFRFKILAVIQIFIIIKIDKGVKL